MRFSLSTLVLVVLWVGALATVWVQREAWIRYTPASIAGIGDKVRATAPDGRRQIEIQHVDEHPDCVAIVEVGREYNDRILWQFEGNFSFAGFIDDDHIWFDDYSKIQTYRRRHPEWWWGQFYRPEVWVAIFVSLLAAWRVMTKCQSKTAPNAGREK